MRLVPVNVCAITASRLVAVSNGDHAERRLADVQPDLVLADIFMPGKNGYELCETIKNSPPFQHIPVILLVGAFEPFVTAFL